MIDVKSIHSKLQEQALKERMILDSLIILATVEYFQDRIEEKLLEIDALQDDYKFDEISLIKQQVLQLIAKLRREEQRMDEFMIKYKKVIDEKKALLSRPVQGRQVYLRGVPANQRRQNQSSTVSEKDETPA